MDMGSCHPRRGSFPAVGAHLADAQPIGRFHADRSPPLTTWESVSSRLTRSSGHYTRRTMRGRATRSGSVPSLQVNTTRSSPPRPPLPRYPRNHSRRRFRGFPPPSPFGGYTQSTPIDGGV